MRMKYAYEKKMFVCMKINNTNEHFKIFSTTTFRWKGVWRTNDCQTIDCQTIDYRTIDLELMTVRLMLIH
jgi:hypothetical protein